MVNSHGLGLGWLEHNSPAGAPIHKGIESILQDCRAVVNGIHGEQALKQRCVVGISGQIYTWWKVVIGIGREEEEQCRSQQATLRNTGCDAVWAGRLPTNDNTQAPVQQVVPQPCKEHARYTVLLGFVDHTWVGDSIERSSIIHSSNPHSSAPCSHGTPTMV